MKFLRTLLILGRVSNLPTVWTNAIAGYLVGGGFFEAEIGWILGGISLLYCGGMTLNDAFDAGWDQEHAPERPIPSGALSRSATWWIGGMQLVAGSALILTTTEVGGTVLAALIASILGYNILHKRWVGSVILMGLCRALVYYAAWTAARSGMQLGPVSPLIHLIAVGTVLYVAGLTLAARSERIAAAPLTSPLSRFLLLIPSAFPLFTLYTESTLDLSRTWVIAGTLAAGAWIILCRTLLFRGKLSRGIPFAIAGIALYDATVAILLDVNGGIFCLCCFGLTLLAQRFVPAT